jgi:hypothetical protein
MAVRHPLPELKARPIQALLHGHVEAKYDTGQARLYAAATATDSKTCLNLIITGLQVKI